MRRAFLLWAGVMGLGVARCVGDNTVMPTPDAGMDSSVQDNSAPEAAADTGSMDVVNEQPPPCNVDAGMLMCGMSCVNPATDPHNCGACMHDCLGGMCVTSDAGASKPMCQPVTLASGLMTSSAWAMATDGTSVVFTDDSTGVYSLNASGTNQTPFQVQSGDSRPITIVNGDMYWIELGSSSANTMWKGKPGMTTNNQLNIPSSELGDFPPNVPYGIAVDALETYVGFLAYGNSTDYFGSCKLSTLACSSSTSGSQTSLPSNMITDGKSLFWGESTTIEQTALAFGTVTNILSSQPVPNAISLAGAGYIVWYNGGNTTINRSPILSPTAQNLTTSTYVTSLSADAKYVYWSNGTELQYVDQTGSGTPQLLVGNIMPGAITQDTVALYWYDGSGAVMKVALPL